MITTLIIVYVLLSIMLLVLQPHVDWHKTSSFLTWVLFIIFIIPICLQYFWLKNWDSENNYIEYAERGIKIK